jgi:hypothetical protein
MNEVGKRTSSPEEKRKKGQMESETKANREDARTE